MIYLKRFADDLFGVKRHSFVFDKKIFAVVTDQHGGKKAAWGNREDHHDRMTCSGTRHLLMLNWLNKFSVILAVANVYGLGQSQSPQMVGALIYLPRGPRRI